MKTITVSETRKSREYISNSYSDCDLDNRLKNSNCSHYLNDVEIIDLGNGYSRIALANK